MQWWNITSFLILSLYLMLTNTPSMRKLLFVLSFVVSFSGFAQAPDKPTASEIYESIKQLNFLGSVLYIAAHPDDENTALISYFANEVHARTAYISLTRGDGGQNLIGPELNELLGVIRTQELLQARKQDGGIQYFSRAVDFGYSKNPTETFEFWDKEELLRDLVYRIRAFQPDIIINRFDHRTSGTTHGHHTASAILGVEAFDLAADPEVFKEQLTAVAPWQAKRLFFNDSWFFYGSPEAFNKVDQSEKFEMDIGSFYPSLGLSNNEISALSRSAHSSQGFGSSGSRGEKMEYLEPIRGGMPNKHVFEGIDTSWSRIEGGTPVGRVLAKVEEEYDFRNPAASIPDLLKAYKLIKNIEDSHWKKIKTKEIIGVIEACAGLYLEAVAESPTAVAGGQTKMNIEAINRSYYPIHLESVAIGNTKLDMNTTLDNNISHQESINLQIPINQKPTNAYWLDEPGSLGMYKVANEALSGLAETPPAFTAEFKLNFDGEPITINKPVVYRYTDLAKGELYEPFVIVPKASVAVEGKVHVFGDANSKVIRVRVKSFTEDLKADLKLDVPHDWKVSPKNHKVQFAQKGATQYYEFLVYPPAEQSEVIATPELVIGDEVLNKQIHELSYAHIPAQKVLLPGASKLVHIDIERMGYRIGYIQGAGDEVGDYLKQIGYQVEELTTSDISLGKLKKYDAVVLGIRAFNVLEPLQYKNDILFQYVQEGGNMVVQYNVNRSQLVTEAVAPFPLSISRNRVTDEDSEVRFIDENHPVLNYPNKITQKDFEGWVQERGLYFPNQWDAAFTPILSMHDKGEEPVEGSLLIAQYGKGYYVYTGLSFFRELPAGVPGAYQLFANLLSIGKTVSDE